MKNKINFAAAVLALSFLSSSARAEQKFGYLPEPAFDGIVNRAIEMIEPQDPFLSEAACRIVDARTIRPYELNEAVETLKPCLAAISSQLSVKAGQAEILIETDMAVASPLMRGINFALNVRRGRLLGHPAKLGRPAAKIARSAVQGALDRCLMPMVVRKVETSADFVRVYGGCITRDSSLKVREIRPAQGRDMAVTLLSDADTRQVQGFNGTVTVNPGSGPVTIMVMAYPQNLYLP